MLRPFLLTLTVPCAMSHPSSFFVMLKLLVQRKKILLLSFPGAVFANIILLRNCICVHAPTISAAILFYLRHDVGVEQQAMVRTRGACLEIILVPTGELNIANTDGVQSK